ncbi:MAG: hypothetical protein ACFE9I_02515 [Candidatus Hermodarchaeota archaeon]
MSVKNNILMSNISNYYNIYYYSLPLITPKLNNMINGSIALISGYKKI